MTDEQAAQVQTLKEFDNYQHSPDSRVLLLAIIEWLDFSEKEVSRWPALETVLFNALAARERAVDDAWAQAIITAHPSYLYIAGETREALLRCVFAGIIKEAQRAVWLEAARLIEEGVDVSYECGPDNWKTFKSNDCKRMAARCREQAEAVKL